MSAPHILVVDDEADIRSLVQEILAEEGYSVSVAGNAEEARAARRLQRPDLVLLDIWMPDTDGISLLREWAGEPETCPVVMMSGHGTVDTAIEATRLGAVDFIEKPLSLVKLLRSVEKALARLQPAAPKRRAPAPLLEPVGRSSIMQSLREQIRRVAVLESPVLFTGEAGTGRETLARYLHALSPHGAGPFVNLPLGALTDADAARLLFGTEQAGRITPGYFEQAQDGTLFLNELGDAGPETQRLLLAVLEAGAFTRAGGTQPVPLTARIVSSAQPDILMRAEQGAFRRDLLNHLDVVHVRIPPLREYREDVPDLLRHHVDLLVDSERLPYRRFSIAAQNRLRLYPWPGNIRELRNLVHHLLSQGGGEEITLAEVEAELARHRATAALPLVKEDLLALPLRAAREKFERAYLEQQLQLAGGKVGRLAERVGMERTHLYRKLKALGIDISRLAGEEPPE